MKCGTELYEVAKALKANDVIEYHNLMKAYEEVKTARVASVELRMVDGQEAVWIIYVPCKLSNSVECGFGSQTITVDGEDGRDKWGWQSIKVVGTEQPRKEPQRPNLYRNPGYDLVNM